MRAWTAERLAAASGAELVRAGDGEEGPRGVGIDSREAEPGMLFVGLPGAREDGGRFGRSVLEDGAWGVLVAPGHAGDAAEAGRGAVLAAGDPLAALGRLAGAWRRELGARVIGVTGSTGKTSTKEILLGLLAPHRRTVASRANLNTEIGLPLELLGASARTEVLVLEMAMRGAGQIAELAAIAEPDVGIVVNVGPVHLERLGTVEAVAAAKAELIAALPAGGTAIVPAGESLLAPHRRDDVEWVEFGAGGDVELLERDGQRVRLRAGADELSLEVPFAQPHLLEDLLAAVAAARAVGVRPGGRLAVARSPGRGEERTRPDGTVVIDDCYNANPMSMRAALDDLARRPGRKVAVLGDMLELGPEEARFHAELGAEARARGVDRLVAVGPRAAAAAAAFGPGAQPVADAAAAAELVRRLVRPGDAVLVKGSRGVGLEVVCRALDGAG